MDLLFYKKLQQAIGLKSVIAEAFIGRQVLN